MEEWIPPVGKENYFVQTDTPEIRQLKENLLKNIQMRWKECECHCLEVTDQFGEKEIFVFSYTTTCYFKRWEQISWLFWNLNILPMHKYLYVDPTPPPPKNSNSSSYSSSFE